MTILILKNVSLLVRAIIRNVRSRITVWVRCVMENMPPVNVHPAAQGMIIPLSPKAMFKTGKPVWTVTARPNIKSNPTPVTGLWTVVLWAEKPGRRPACREQPPCMTTVRLAPTSALSPAVRHLSPAPMKNAPASGIKLAANPDMIGMQAPKLVPSNAHPTINTPVPAPVTPAVQVQPAVENTKAANVLPDIFGVEVGA